MKKALFIDRDGTLIFEPEDEQIDSFEKLRFIPGVFNALRKITNLTDYELVMVTNQDGLGTASFPEETFWPVQNFVIRALEDEGVKFSKIFIDRTFPEDNAPTRKPGTAMLKEYMNGDYDLAASYVIGDRDTDVKLAENLSCQALTLTETMNWDKIADIVVAGCRKAAVHRITGETDIYMEINLDGEGKSDISTGLGFFDHMLTALAVHGGFGLRLKAEGDWNVDCHHTVEDTGIVLGRAFKQALGDRSGIVRYGHAMIPMDEALGFCAVDVSGRPYLVFDAAFPQERVGDFDTCMTEEFFRALSDNAGFTLHLRCPYGKNSHHMIEALFKACAHALCDATAENSTGAVLSTKGTLSE